MLTVTYVYSNRKHLEFQGLAKYIFSLRRRQRIINIIKFIDDIYLECQKISENYRVILTKTANVAMIGMKLVGFLYTTTATSLVLFPLFYRLIFGKRLFIMRFFIPGLDPNSTMGYFVHMLIQFICIFFGAFGNFSSDIFLIVLVLHVPLLKDIITEKLNELNRTQLKKRKTLLKDTFEWHQRCDL
uniref:Odorant receptor n=1 Tax=Glossina pallidipes TaxID=7398 RepID=A0A1B0ADI1_GLOPL